MNERSDCMELSRRRFHLVALSAATALAGERAFGEEAATTAPATTAPSEDAAGPPVDAGPIGGFGSDGVFADFREQGFFVIRRRKKIFVLSAICTHKGCKVRLDEDQSFYCKCHGSTFDENGRVTKGPAKGSLPRLAVKLDERKHLLVDRSQKIENRA